MDDLYPVEERSGPGVFSVVVGVLAVLGAIWVIGWVLSTFALLLRVAVLVGVIAAAVWLIRGPRRG